MDDNEQYLQVLRHALRARDAALYASLSHQHSLAALLRSYTRRTAPHRRWLRHRELSRWLRDRPDHLSLLQERALLRLDLGKGRLPGMLVLGAEDPHLFRPTQGSDLLAFFGGVFERMMRRWLG